MLDIRIRTDEPERGCILRTLDKMPSRYKVAFFHLLKLLQHGLDDDVLRITLDRRFEASYRDIGSGWSVGFVYDPQAGEIVVLILQNGSITRSLLYREAVKALRLVNPVREDH